MHHHQLSRRRFLRNTALTTGTLAAAQYLRAAPASTAPSAMNKVNVAVIGVGGRGNGDMRESADAGANIVAICDIDESFLKRHAVKFPGARLWRDYRKMLDEQKDIDAVIVATPDHTHAPSALMAMALGKHVYCEKPLTHDLYEARKLTETAAANPKLMTQMGNQHHSENGLLTAVECVRSGMIGTVRQIHCFTNRPIWPQGSDALHRRAATPPPVPGTVDWDLWLGPAQPRAYDPIYHPFKWRGWWDFGTGALGDMGCHIMDVPVFALGLERAAPRFVDPLLVRDATSETAPAASIIRYEYASIPAHEPMVRPASTQPGAASAPVPRPARTHEPESETEPEPAGDTPQVTLYWYDGGELPLAFSHEIRKRLGYDKAPPATNPSERGRREENVRNGTIFVGDNGILYVPVEGRPHFLDADRDREFKAPERTLRRPRSHHGEWIDAISGVSSRPPNSNFAYSGPLTELVLLGNLALRTGQRIEWDSKNLRVTNVPEANQYVRGQYRKGWDV